MLLDNPYEIQILQVTIVGKTYEHMAEEDVRCYNTRMTDFYDCKEGNKEKDQLSAEKQDLPFQIVVLRRHLVV